MRLAGRNAAVPITVTCAQRVPNQRTISILQVAVDTRIAQGFLALFNFVAFGD
jgi:hypothetical protein